MSSELHGEFGTVSAAVVLLSGGLDSSYNLVKALEKFSVRLVLTFDYGQRAAEREIHSARRLAKTYLVEHRVVSLPWFKDFSKSSLTSAEEVPRGSVVQIDSLTRSLETASRVWVPNRNGIFLNIAAGFAEGLGAGVIVPGFNVEEANTFPDNSADFLHALDSSFSFSTATKVRTFCFSTAMNKTSIVTDAIKSGLDLTVLWPCYLNQPQWCGECESCQRFARAVEANGLVFEKLQRGQR